MNDVVVVEKIKDSRAPFCRPELPQEESASVQPGMLTLMKQCWAEDPCERPSFDEVAKALKTVNKGKLALFVIKHSRYILRIAALIGDGIIFGMKLMVTDCPENAKFC